MKNTRFYLEFPDATAKRKSGKSNIGHSGNVIAIWPEQYYISVEGVMFDGMSGVYSCENSPVCSGGASLGYLQSNCKRISEKLAREIHPELFVRLDESE